jgi:S1-C subfamily serine protease
MRARFVVALFAALALAGTVTTGAQELKLVRSLSGPSGKMIGADFVLDETRNRFVYPQDQSLVVYFEFDAPAGDHVLTATWKRPDGRVASVSPDVKMQTTTPGLKCYWIFNVTPGIPNGTWTVEVRVDGRPGATHAFELAGMDPASERFTLDRVSKAYAASVVQIRRIDRPGRPASTKAGFVIDANTIATAFQVVDGATSLDVQFADGRKVPATEVLALSRVGDWALLRVDTTGIPAIPRGAASSIPIGGRLATFSTNAGIQVISPVDVGAVAPQPGFGTRVKISPAISADSVGGPLIDEQGKVVAILGGSLAPGLPSRLRLTTNGDSRRLDGGDTATAIEELPAVVPAAGRSLDQLRSENVMTPGIIDMPELIYGGMTRQLPKLLEDRVSDSTQFSAHEDAQFFVYTGWIKRSKISKGEVSGTVSDLANHVITTIPAKKISLSTDREQRVSFSVSPRNIQPGSYRIDVTWDGQPAWRAYVRITE